MGVTKTLRAAALVSVLGLALTSCASDAEYRQALADERTAEEVLARAQALPDDLEGKAEVVARATAEEARLQAIREDAERLGQRGLIDSGLQVGTDIATGNYRGALEGAFAILTAGGLWWIRRRNKEEREEDEAKTLAKLEALERRRDESRARQGIAPTSARSVEQVSSAAALAAKREQGIQTQDAVAQQVALILNRTPQVAPLGAPAHAPSAAAPGPPLAQQAAAPTPPAATFYGDPNRFPVPGVVPGPSGVNA